ncbi:CPBP family intramembrane glutamic endopeptidase [Halococcus morrhuae]
MVLVLAVLSFVVIAPAEEYLFRGVIQRRLTRSMRTPAAVGVAALLFVIPHAIGYLGGIQAIVLLSIAPFSLAVILGALYEKYDNLSVPILAHGLYNATLFLTTILGALYEKYDNLSVPILAHGLYNATLFLTTYVTAF